MSRDDDGGYRVREGLSRRIRSIGINDDPDVSDKEKAMDIDENAQLERAIVSAATHRGGEKRKCSDLSDVESDGDGERTVEGGGDDSRGSVGDGDGQRTVEGDGDDARGSVGDGERTVVEYFLNTIILFFFFFFL